MLLTVLAGAIFSTFNWSENRQAGHIFGYIHDARKSGFIGIFLARRGHSNASLLDSVATGVIGEKEHRRGVKYGRRGFVLFLAAKDLGDLYDAGLEG